MYYVKKTEAFKKMREAEKKLQTVVVLAHAGWGKSTLVKNCFKRQSFLLLSGETGTLSDMPKIEKIRQGMIVVDDVSWIDDEQSENYIKELIADSGKFVVLAGRGRFPKWLEETALKIDFTHITDSDLKLDETDILEIFQKEGKFLTEDEVTLLAEKTKGYPPSVKLSLRYHTQEAAISEASIARTRMGLFHYFDETFFVKIKDAAQQFLLKICELEYFSMELAEMLEGEEKARELIDYCERVGSFLKKTSHDTWEIIEEVREFLKWKKSALWSIEQRIENDRNIAAWCEKALDLAGAADLYERVGDADKIRELLVKNSRMHPGIGHFHALKRHYESLPEEVILQEPALITGMSLVKSMTMRADESERWYGELESFADNTNNSPEKRKEAKVLQKYLEIGLPHRSGKNMIDNLLAAADMMQEEDLALPEFSVTDNIPSVINGGLDYSSWIKDAKQLGQQMGPVFEKVLGRHSKGLVDIGIAEAGFELNTMDATEVISLASKGVAKASNTGSIEIAFAGYGLLIRQNLVLGNVKTARNYLDAFSDKAKTENAQQLYSNLEAMETIMALYESDNRKIKRWVSKTPDIHRDFSILDRYVYQVKLHCLIALGRLSEASDLGGYLDWYYREYECIYAQIENYALMAIVYFRQGLSEWRQLLTKALTISEKYHYVQRLSMKGAALLPLLLELETEEVSEQFLQKIRAQCREMALKYPDFLKNINVSVSGFTPREKEILALLCAGESMDNICKIFGISYSGLKKHNRNIYTKLGAKNRAEAERTAISLGLVKRLE